MEPREGMIPEAVRVCVKSSQGWSFLVLTRKQYPLRPVDQTMKTSCRGSYM